MKRIIICLTLALASSTAFGVYTNESRGVVYSVSNNTMSILDGDIEITGTYTGDGSGLTNVATADLALKVDKAGDTMTGALDMSTNTLNNVLSTVYTGTDNGTNYVAAMQWDAENKVFTVTETAQ